MVLNSREKKRLGYLIILNAIISVIDIASLAVLLFMVNFYTQKISNPDSFLPRNLSDPHSVLLMAVFFVLFSLKSFAGYSILQAQYKFVYNTASRISENSLINYLEGSHNDFVRIDSAVHIRRISQQPIEFAHYVLAGVQLIFTESFLVLLTVTAILFFSIKLFFLLFILLMPVVVILSFLIKQRLRAVRANVKIKGEKALQYLHEALSGFIESNVYDRNDFFAGRYGSSQKSLNGYLAELQSTQGMSSRIIETFAIFGLFILIIADKLSGSAIGLASIAAFVAAAYKIIPGIVKILNTAGQVKAYGFSTKGLSREIAATDKREQNFCNLIHSLAFHQVEFSFQKNKILERFCMQLKTGEFIGISGLSGKGKTTIVNLLLGFLEPDAGSIEINKKKSDASERQSYMADIAYVKQQPFLIHDSILNNIVLGDMQYDKDRFGIALKVSGLTEIVSLFPDGLQKLIEEGGKNISGGQRQRIAIARAVYKNPTLIILDEPFNELDEESEHYMLEYFRCIAKRGKMIVLITHNKKSFSFCNRIISLDE